VCYYAACWRTDAPHTPRINVREHAKESPHGPSAVDLPDPLNNPDDRAGRPRRGRSALALAGDEIDRLMRDDRPLPVLELRPPEPRRRPVQEASPVVEAPDVRRRCARSAGGKRTSRIL